MRVRTVRFFGLMLAGFLGGIAGLSALLSLGAGWRMAWGVGGLGYAALALSLAGKNGPFRVFAAALFLTALSGGAMWLGAPESVQRLLPVLAALILLAAKGRSSLIEGEAS